VPLAPGSRLGPYEILTPLGAGGMGEVYRARDTRLKRDVAIKVLHPELAKNPGRLSRFVQEARAASALNHPNVITVYDFGRANGIAYVAMELVEGGSMRELCANGPLPPRKILSLAPQIAEGLAKAHAAGIIHRDLKPENVMISRDGFVKLVDFGLAKLALPESEETSAMPTAAPQTRPGIVMGTPAYMSPEQASGQPLDFRSDQFSLGSILYEMVTGRLPFAGKTGPETLVAIIREEPTPIGQLVPTTPAPLSWIIDRCLAKDPEGRFASTLDLARDLASVRDHLSEAGGATVAPPRIRPRPLTLAAGAILLAGLMAVSAFLLGTRRAERPPPSFQRLTFRRGTVLSARFAPDGQTVLYSASWDGHPPAVYLKRPESPDAVSLALPSAEILAISPTGEMAIQLHRRFAHTGVSRGTLARVALGGTPREISENVNQVDWRFDGSLVVARDVAEKGRLEYPLGKVLYQTTGHVSFPRFSPRGDLIAFIDHPFPLDDRGSVAVTDLYGNKRTLSKEWGSVEGLAWSPSGAEVWFTAAVTGSDHALYGATLSGRQRLIARVAGALRLQDISRTGRVLLTRDDGRFGIMCLAPGEARERKLSWLGWSRLADLSRDGKEIVFAEAGEAAGPNYAVCLRKTDGSPVVRLGEGYAGGLSPDGKWVPSCLPNPGAPIVLLPTGPGEPKEISTRGLSVRFISWFPDGEHVLLRARERGRELDRLYVQNVGGEEPRSISPEGAGGGIEGLSGGIAISPDGKLVASVGSDRKIALYPVDGGEPMPVPGAAEEEHPVQWSSDGNFLYVKEPAEFFSPARVFRLNLKSGKRVLWRELLPEDSAGVVGVIGVCVTPDGSSYAYDYQRILSDIYVGEGLK
jgi:Tol biopolymer transport system component